jgi:hypothetical protein
MRFDEESYQRFFHLAKLNGINIPVNEVFTKSASAMHFIRIQRS